MTPNLVNTVILEANRISKFTILAFHKLLIFISWSVSQYTLILKTSKLLILVNSKNLRTLRKLIAYENFQDYSMIRKQKSLHRRSNRQNKNLISEHRVSRDQTSHLYRQLKNRYFQQVLQSLLQEIPLPFLECNQPYHWSEKPAFSVTAELCDLTDHYQVTLSTWSFKGVTKRPSNQAFAMWVLSYLFSRGTTATEGSWPV